MAKSWYYRVGNAMHGPIGFSQLQQLAGSGVVTAETKVREGELGKWTSASQVSGLLSGESLVETLPVAASLVEPQLVEPQLVEPEPSRGRMTLKEVAARHHAKAQITLTMLLDNPRQFLDPLGEKESPAIREALEEVDRALQLRPEDTEFLKTKALLLWHGLGRVDEAQKLLDLAATLSPRDVTIPPLRQKTEASCFLATAAYGTTLSSELDVLRQWRDERLSPSPWGRVLVKAYYWASPSIARWVRRSPWLRRMTRRLLCGVIKRLKR